MSYSNFLFCSNLSVDVTVYDVNLRSVLLICIQYSCDVMVMVNVILIMTQVTDVTCIMLCPVVISCSIEFMEAQQHNMGN